MGKKQSNTDEGENPVRDFTFSEMTALLRKTAGRHVTRVEAARQLCFKEIPEKIQIYQKKCKERVQAFNEDEKAVQDKKQEAPRKVLKPDELSFLQTKYRLLHNRVRERRIRDIQNYVLITGQENAVDALRLQTFIDLNFKSPKVPRSLTMSHREVADPER